MTTHSNIMAMIDDYLDEVDSANKSGNFIVVREMYINLSNKIKELCDNQYKLISEENYVPVHHNHKKKPCSCDGWGCWNCCSSLQEIQSRQGTFG